MTCLRWMITITFGIIIHAAAVAAVRSDEPIQPIEVPSNLNEKKVKLGKKLFFEPRLSRSGFISCNSCHNLGTGGVDNMPASIGHRWQKGPINSPTVYNAVYNIAQFWDGRAKDLAEQAIGPIANPLEMGSTHELSTKILNSIPQYQAWFREVYGKGPITIEQVGDAIAEFEKSLVTPNSRFDQWLKGNDKALTAQELRGYQTFKTKGCVACHNGPALGGTSFHKFGVIKPYHDTKTLGRFDVTRNEADKFVFKVPTLRNIELTYPYFHDGSVWSLEEAVEIMASLQLGQTLTKAETADIVAFLRTLTGEMPKVEYPMLPPSSKVTPRPEM